MALLHRRNNSFTPEGHGLSNALTFIRPYALCMEKDTETDAMSKLHAAFLSGVPPFSKSLLTILTSL